MAEQFSESADFVPFSYPKEIPSVYEQADMICVPSVCDDSCPLVVNEALASGLPIVASPRGGIPEQLGGAGMLVDPTNIRGLADALGSLVRDVGLRAELGAASRARAEEISWTRQFDLLRSHLT